MSLRRRLADFFNLQEHDARPRTELLAGGTTFLTMAYIIFVNPAVLSGFMFGEELHTGLDFGALTTATCLAAAFGSILMGLLARLPVALAPGMGANFFFTLTLIPAAVAVYGPERGPAAALGVIFVAGLLFFVISVSGLRGLVMNAVGQDLKNAIAAGIGIFIAFIGLQNARLIVPDAGTAVTLSTTLASPDLIVFFAGLLLTAALQARRVPGAILLGILGATLLTLALRFALPLNPKLAAHPFVVDSLLMTRFAPAESLLSAPPSLAPTFFQIDLTAALGLTLLPYVLIFLFLDLFDTMGTLVAVGEQGGLMRDGKLPRANRAFAADASATVAGAALGTSTVTAYIESAAGIQAGGRTGITAIVTGVLFLLALFFTPIIAMVGSYPPVTAPALVVVGAMMLQNVRKIRFEDPAEALPAFLILLGIPLSYSIADGIALGLLSHVLIKLLAGRGREVPITLYVLAALLLGYFFVLRMGYE